MHKSALILCGAVVFLAAPGCPKQKKQTAPVQPQISDVETAAPAPVKPSPPATQPATQPAATQPVTTRPASKYNSKPPYPVELYVSAPDEKQPGWIRIMELTDDKTLATSKGTFPEQNRIYINTDNVQRIRIHIKHLPMNRKKRTILRIDEQPMVLSTKKQREYVYLRRLSIGEWVVDTSSEQ